MKKQISGLALAFVIVLASCSTSQACNGCGGGYGWGGGWGGLGLGFLYNSLEFRVPYFAAHPPVYYSYPVPRPYGYSPFAYPPYVETPEILGDIDPATIVNPYVPSSNTTELEPEDQLTSRKQPEPLVIANPYYQPTQQVAQASR